MSGLIFLISIFGLVGLFAAGMNYERSKSFTDVVLGIASSASAVWQLIDNLLL